MGSASCFPSLNLEQPSLKKKKKKKSIDDVITYLIIKTLWQIQQWFSQ
ncbi:hypothetical protein ACMBCN_01815 [Candidatus Liberibacter asiaticus]